MSIPGEILMEGWFQKIKYRDTLYGFGFVSLATSCQYFPDGNKFSFLNITWKFIYD